GAAGEQADQGAGRGALRTQRDRTADGNPRRTAQARLTDHSRLRRGLLNLALVFRTVASGGLRSLSVGRPECAHPARRKSNTTGSRKAAMPPPTALASSKAVSAQAISRSRS